MTERFDKMKEKKKIESMNIGRRIEEPAKLQKE
jgi:hypothetical protein